MKSRLNTTFLFALLILVGIGVYKIFQPFLVAILVAFILSQLFRKVHQKILRKIGRKRKIWASAIMCFVIFLLIFVPLALITSLVINETNNLYQNFQENDIKNKLSQSLEELSFSNIGLPLSDEELRTMVGADKLAEAIKNVGSVMIGVAKKTYQGTSQFLFMTFVMFFSLYYFFKDGDKMIKKIMTLSPLKDSQEQKLLEKFVEISRATLKGSLVIAIIQGLAMGALFALAGVKSATLWGIITVVLSLIPMLGVVLVWLPVGIVMILMGYALQGIAILVVGGVVISSIDNLLRPKLVGDDSSLHPLLVFLSTLGGLAVFGIAGFLIGPVIMVLFITLLEIYQSYFRSDLKKFNK